MTCEILTQRTELLSPGNSQGGRTKKKATIPTTLTDYDSDAGSDTYKEGMQLLGFSNEVPDLKKFKKLYDTNVLFRWMAFQAMEFIFKPCLDARTVSDSSFDNRLYQQSMLVFNGLLKKQTKFDFLVLLVVLCMEYKDCKAITADKDNILEYWEKPVKLQE